MIMKIMEKESTHPPRLPLDNRAGRGQKYIMKRMIPALLLLAVCGCGAGYDFSPYYGQQQNWQTQAGGYVKVVDKATLYAPGQFPARPYIILGSVRGGGEDDIAKAVRDQHADAALIFSDQRYRDGSIAMAGPGVVWATPITHTVIKAQLIKYK
jgi:hypothetical protein